MMLPSAASLSLSIQASFLISFCLPFSTHKLGNVRENRPPKLHPFHHIVPSSKCSSSSSLHNQILDFIEPETGVPIKLIGAMHYNPASIKLATTAINSLAAEDKLGSIIIESCEIRWNATLENEFVQSALQSEMRAAHDLGMLYGRPVVLGDQRINITVAQLKNGAKEAVLDLFQPWNGGWGRLWESIRLAREEAVPLGDEFLGIDSFLDPQLLLAAPVSLVKYPLSYFVKSPVVGVVALSLVVLLGGGEASDAYAAESVSASDMLVSLFVSALETIIFARIFLKELLAERNDVLALNILEQCRNYRARGGSVSSWNFFQSKNDVDKSTGAVYAPGSVKGKPEEGKVVVAVLGLAHCNGIKKILAEGKLL